jgi:integrase
MGSGIICVSVSGDAADRFNINTRITGGPQEDRDPGPLGNSPARTKQRCGQVFRHGIGLGYCPRDITVDMRGLLEAPIVEHYASINEPAKVGALLRAIEGYTGRRETVLALRLSPLVFVRPGELRKAEWEHFDFEEAHWRIPARLMKMKVQHIVPLSHQAIKILRELFAITGRGRFGFPALGDPERTMSENSITKALRIMGYTAEDMTAHGFRSMASTLLNEQGWPPDAVERQLAQVEQDEVRGAYNYAQQVTLGRQMMQVWADYLDGLRDHSIRGNHARANCLPLDFRNAGELVRTLSDGLTRMS